MDGLKLILRLLLLATALLLHSFSLQAQEDDKTLSWIASGSAQATYGIDNLGFSTTLEGTQQEINFLQDRNSFTNLFTGWHFIS